ncbi:MAG: hypothetical protein EBZ96_05725, partial [Synechococcaceae bacterium WB9_3_282]|nr:hypothetical protein [Synechococcaceae bacterium WB9_3_282]
MRLLLVSNGHGEDLSGALLAQALQQQGAEVAALPLVGDGAPYLTAGIAVLGSTRSYSTGGLGYTSAAGRWAEILQGQVFYLLKRSLRLWQESRRADGLVVVGDVIPVLLCWLLGKPVFTYLVAYSSHYEGRLRLPWPCGACLASKRFKAVFSRDELTAIDLSQQLGRSVQFLGNPFMEKVLANASASINKKQLALLPGSRLPEALNNLELMLKLLELLPSRACNWCFQAALVAELDATAVAQLATGRGWRCNGKFLQWQGLALELCWGKFNQVLAECSVALSMAGTATEQAVGLGKPVLQLAGHGPQFTEGFAEAQRRLLGPALFCAPGPAGAPETLGASAKLLLALMAPNDPQQWQRHQQLW